MFLEVADKRAPIRKFTFRKCKDRSPTGHWSHNTDHDQCFPNKGLFGTNTCRCSPDESRLHQEERLSVAGEAGSKNKRWAEKQKSKQLAHINKNKHRSQHTITTVLKQHSGRAGEDELEINTAAPGELMSSRWETPEEGLEKSGCHTQPAQMRQMSTKTGQGNKAATNLTSTSSQKKESTLDWWGTESLDDWRG